LSKFLKALEKAKRNRKTTKYSELIWLAEHVSFVFDRQNSSHVIYKNELFNDAEITFVKHSNGIAKKYNVDQLIDFIEEHGLDKRGEEAE
jgi:hypothetical protein